MDPIMTRCAAQPATVTARDVRRWAATHRAKSGDPMGWSGQLLDDMVRVDPAVATTFAGVLSVPARQWRSRELAAVVWRTNTGNLLPQPGKGPRPISAPSIPRRIVSAAHSRTIRTAASAYSAARGHVGMAGGAHNYLYAAWPRIVVAMGGDYHAGDRSKSYQTLGRLPMLQALVSLADREADAGHPKTVAAVDALYSACLFDSPILPRTTTTFPHRPDATSHALAQGCSSSPVAQTVTLARHVPLSHAPGVTRLAAHDDIHLCALPAAPIASLRLPEAGSVGGCYNPSKDVWVGPRAAEAVAQGIAARHDTMATCFGAPVGDVRRWTREVLLPRAMRTIESITELASAAPDTAIAVAHLLRGPGTFLAYQLSFIPPSAGVADILANIDERWAALVASLAGATLTPRIRATIYGAAPHCMRHLEAAAHHAQVFYEGLSRGWQQIASTAAAASMPIHEVAAAAGIPEAGGGSPAARLQKALAAARHASSTRHTAIAPPMTDGSVPGAAAPGGDDGIPSLWVLALEPWNPASPTRDPTTRPLALARVLGVPIWPALGVPPPAVCPGCRSPRDPDLGRSEPFREHKAQIAGRLDDFGEHVLACHRIVPHGGLHRRHNTWARALVRVATACCADVEYHDGPGLFTDGSRKRPADFLQKRVAQYPAGVACDTTVGLRIVSKARDRATNKHRKLRNVLPSHPGLGFVAVAADLAGDSAEEVGRLVSGWVKSLSNGRARARAHPGAPSTEVPAAFGHAFAGAMADYISCLSSPL